MFTLNKIKAFFIFILSLLSAFVWGFDLMVRALIIALSIDYVLGFHWAWRTWTLSNKKWTEGLWKMFFIACAVGVSVQVDIMIFHQEIEWGFHNAMVTAIWIKTAIDILTKFVRLWVPIPKWLVAKLQNYYDNIDFCRRETDKENPICIPEEITEEPTEENNP